MEKVKNKNKSKSKINVIIILSIIGLIIIDQVLKIFLGANNTSGDNNFTYMAMSLLVLVIIVKFLTTQNQLIDLKTKIFLALIISGGVSNIIDKIFRGSVVNYIKIGDTVSFNLAHIYILIGWLCMAAIFAHFSSKELKNKKGE